MRSYRDLSIARSLTPVELIFFRSCSLVVLARFSEKRFQQTLWDAVRPHSKKLDQCVIVFTDLFHTYENNLKSSVRPIMDTVIHHMTLFCFPKLINANWLIQRIKTIEVKPTLIFAKCGSDLSNTCKGTSVTIKAMCYKLSWFTLYTQYTHCSNNCT